MPRKNTPRESIDQRQYIALAPMPTPAPAPAPPATSSSSALDYIALVSGSAKTKAEATAISPKKSLANRAKMDGLYMLAQTCSQRSYQPESDKTKSKVEFLEKQLNTLWQESRKEKKVMEILLQESDKRMRTLWQDNENLKILEQKSKEETKTLMEQIKVLVYECDRGKILRQDHEKLKILWRKSKLEMNILREEMKVLKEEQANVIQDNNKYCNRLKVMELKLSNLEADSTDAPSVVNTSILEADSTDTSPAAATLTRQIPSSVTKSDLTTKQRRKRKMDSSPAPLSDKHSNRKRKKGKKSSYNIFYARYALQYKQMDSGVPSEAGSFTSLAANAWKELSPEEKQYYERKANKENYAKSVDKGKKTKEASSSKSCRSLRRRPSSVDTCPKTSVVDEADIERSHLTHKPQEVNCESSPITCKTKNGEILYFAEEILGERILNGRLEYRIK